MATRRSRLQIKPNIGGPKGSVRNASSIPSSDKVQSQELTQKTSQTEAEKNKKTSSDIQIKQNVNDSVTSSGTKSATESDGKGNKDGTGNSGNSQDGKFAENNTTVSVGRARLRKFGKVNIEAARSVKSSNDSVSEPAEESKASSELNSSKKLKEKQTVLEGHDGKEDKTKLDDQKDKQESTSEGDVKKPGGIPRRSRFPKAKPNVVDVARRKQV